MQTKRKRILGCVLIIMGLVVCMAGIHLAMRPDMFRATARIKVERDRSDIEPLNQQQQHNPYFIQTEFEILQSEIILSKVIDSLDLNKVWATRFGGRAELKTSESLALLRKRLEFIPFRGTTLIDIHAWSEDPAEAARIANALATTYRLWKQERGFELAVSGLKTELEKKDPQWPASSMVEIIERAVPPIRPLSPNGPLRAAQVMATWLVGVVAIGFGILLLRRPRQLA